MKLRYKFASAIGIFLVLSLSSQAVVLSHNTACGPTPEVSDQTLTMKAIVARCYGSPEVLEFAKVEKPTAANDEVLVKIHAAAVNPLDWHFMRGSPYPMRLMSGVGSPKYTSVGVDFAGTVEAIGKDVTRFKPGDEVFGSRRGAFGEYLTIPENRAVALKPANISFEQAASVPVAAITALQALRDSGQLQPGQKVLINGASGGVGTYAVQIAKSFGAQVTGVCSTRNVEMVRTIGADHVIDYTREDYTLSGEHYDLIIDNVGNHSLLANTAVLNPEGTLVIVGAGKGNWIGPFEGPLNSILLAPFVEQELVALSAHETKEDLAILADLMRDGKMVSVIDRRYPLSEVPAAIAYSETGRARGKIVIYME